MISSRLIWPRLGGVTAEFADVAEGRAADLANLLHDLVHSGAEFLSLLDLGLDS